MLSTPAFSLEITSVVFKENLIQEAIWCIYGLFAAQVCKIDLSVKSQADIKKCHCHDSHVSLSHSLMSPVFEWHIAMT